MLTNSIDAVKKQRAMFAREVEYLKETALDDELDARVESAESNFNRETLEELEEAVDMVEKLSADEDVMAESAEVDAILKAEDNITFEHMIGLE